MPHRGELEAAKAARDAARTERERLETALAAKVEAIQREAARQIDAARDEVNGARGAHERAKAAYEACAHECLAAATPES